MFSNDNFVNNIILMMKSKITLILNYVKIMSIL